MDKAIIATESFSHYNMTYFFDYMQAVNGRHYIKLSRSDRQDDGSYQKQGVVFFEDDFEFLLEAMSSLFRTAGFQADRGELRRKLPAVERASGIKSWDVECRPREKLLSEGQEAMADAELIAMLIGSGSPRETAVALAGRILSSLDFNLLRLSRLGIDKLCVFRGMGHAKASSIVAAMELGKRLAEQQLMFVSTAEK